MSGERQGVTDSRRQSQTVSRGRPARPDQAASPAGRRRRMDGRQSQTASPAGRRRRMGVGQSQTVSPAGRRHQETAGKAQEVIPALQVSRGPTTARGQTASKDRQKDRTSQSRADSHRRQGRHGPATGRRQTTDRGRSLIMGHRTRRQRKRAKRSFCLSQRSFCC